MKLCFVLLPSCLSLVSAFVLPLSRNTMPSMTTTTTTPRVVGRPMSNLWHSNQSGTDESSLLHAPPFHSQKSLEWKTWMASWSLGFALLVAPAALIQAAAQPAMAYDPTDYASETVQSTIQALRESAGNADSTYKVYEEMNSIITEGKGVGGSINYKGVQLERGYVADEDTTIYNPGLTLLTESEKERLVEAIIKNRKVALEKGNDAWPQANQLAFEFLREKLDPFHINELRGYLQVLPFYAAAVYLAVLAVQQLVRDFFPAAYIVGVVAIFAPALFLVALGPQ